MVKVFLVEDEYVVRKGIENIDWKANGYEFCGQASDGELALPMIRRLRPDIVITDIKMPFMDGLELTRLIKKDFPWMEVVILSGYAQFEYAKEAISLGVAHYLTKPISSGELLKELGVLSENLETRRSERLVHERYMRDMSENTNREKRELFDHLVKGDKNASELINRARELGYDLAPGYYNIILYRVYSESRSREEYSALMLELEEKLAMAFDRRGVLFFEDGPDGDALLLCSDTPDGLGRIQESVIKDMLLLFSAYEGMRYFGGVGEMVQRLAELPLSYEKAGRAFANRFFTEENRIVLSDELQPGVNLDDGDFNIEEVKPENMDRRRVEEFLRSGQRNETVFFVDEYFEKVGENALKSQLFRQYMAMDIYFAVKSFVEERGREDAKVEPFTPQLLQSTELTLDYLRRIINEAIKLRDGNAMNRHKGIADDIKRYIEENYSDDELTLNKIALGLNFSPGHLSMIFSEQTGSTIVKYLTDYRMSRAKELLRCTSKRSSDIGLEVGYKDPHYFSHIFKKTQNMTPTQYRSMADNGRESET